jgi:hypothetical protein
MLLVMESQSCGGQNKLKLFGLVSGTSLLFFLNAESPG